MPTITVPIGGANYSLYARLKVVRATETPNFIEKGSIQADAANTSDLKVGDKSMTSSDYGQLLHAEDSSTLDGTVLSEIFVRNDGPDVLKVNLNYSAM
jgi:hypothetical protein